MPGKNYNKPANTATPANAAPSTAERSGTAGSVTPTTTTPIRTSSTGYAAPSTSERSGPTYMNPNPVPRNTNGTTPVAAPVSTGSRAANTPAGSSVVIPAGNTTVVPAGSTIKTGTTTVITTPPGNTTTIMPVKTAASVPAKGDTSGFIKEISTQRTNKILFGEVGGPGLAISLNYDARFTSARNGFGFRIGAGYYGDGGNTVFTIPFQINYLIGNNNNFIELGGGTTFLNSTGDNTGKTFIFDRDTGLIGTATIGYRYQSDDKAINFRVGFVPIFYDEGIIYAGGVSIGYTFRAL